MPKEIEDLQTPENMAYPYELMRGIDAANKTNLDLGISVHFNNVYKTYSGTLWFTDRGKDKYYVYKLPELEEEIIRYNFRTIDVENLELEEISENNSIRLVFKIAKELLEIKTTDEAIYEAKVRLAKELSAYDKVKNEEQKKALVYLLEYLFLIEDPKLEKEYDEFKQSMGGVLKMTIDEIREKHLVLKGKEEGEKKKALEIASEMLKDNEPIEKIIKYSKLSEKEILDLKVRLLP